MNSPVLVFDRWWDFILEDGAAKNKTSALFSPYAPPHPFSGPLLIKLRLVYPLRKGEAPKPGQCGLLWRPAPPALIPAVEHILIALDPRFLDLSQVCKLQCSKQAGRSPGIRLKIYTLENE